MSGWLEGKHLRDRMLEFLEFILNNAPIKCLCGNILTMSMIKYTKIGNEYWIFAHCPTCEFDYNYEKIISQFHALRGVTYN